MNTLEDRLRVDLEAAAHEVVVSDEDLRHAEHRYLRRRRELVRIRQSWTVLGVAATTALVVGGGTVLLQELAPVGDPVVPVVAQPDAAPLPLTKSNLAGVWIPSTDSDGWLWIFQADGQAVFINPGDQTVGKGELVPYTLTPTGYTLPPSFCDFDASLDTDGLMDSTVVRIPEPELRQEGCGFPLGDRGTLTRISPASRVGTSLSPSTEGPTQALPVRWTSDLRGAWLKQGTGQLLMVTDDPEGRGLVYRLDDDGRLYDLPDDQGTVELNDGTLTLTSSADSTGCLDGSTTTLTGLHQWFAGGLPMSEAMEGTAVPGGCAEHDDLGGIWIRVS